MVSDKAEESAGLPILLGLPSSYFVLAKKGTFTAKAADPFFTDGADKETQGPYQRVKTAASRYQKLKWLHNAPENMA
jgi:hypothetical protein